MDKRTAFFDQLERLGRDFEKRAVGHDSDDSFVTENFAALREHRIFSAAIPEELGGGGIQHRDMCQGLRMLARHCGSTALALSMHQHLIAFQTHNHLHGKPGRALLEKVSAQQLVLVSTGANDWLGSSGHVEKVDGGYQISAKKPFASGSPKGDLLMTSAPYHDPELGWQVLHFAIPFATDGVHVMQDWKTMGMRGTGSHTVTLKNVFMQDSAVGVRRPRGLFHPAFQAIVTVACPLIMSVYAGIAEAIAHLAREQARSSSHSQAGSRKGDAALPYLLGEMENHLAAAQLAVDSMVALANNLDFEPTLERANAALVRKTLAANAALSTGQKALETYGGGGFYRAAGLEKMLRDLHAGQFHPLPEKMQQEFTGRLALGLEPVIIPEFTG